MRQRTEIVHPETNTTNARAGLTFSLERRDREVCLAVAGELDLATHPALCAAAVEVLQPPVRALLLDLGGVTFCGAAGVTSLLTIRRAAAAAGISLVLTGTQPSVRRVLDLFGTSALIPIAHTRVMRPFSVDSDADRSRKRAGRFRLSRQARAA
jgi:anti-sigma B factor antagonist